MKSKHLVTFFKSMVGWDYQWGAVRWGCVDCSGAFVLAFRYFDQKIYHGSNTIWREYMVYRDKLPTENLQPGSAVFKCRDGADFYHMGLYIGDGQVVEAKGVSHGVVLSNLRDGWTHWGLLDGVEYIDLNANESCDYPFDVMDPMMIVTSGGRLNLRDKPEGAVIDRLPSGTRVIPLCFSLRWVRVYTPAGKLGWVDGSYLTPAPEVDPVENPGETPNEKTEEKEAARYPSGDGSEKVEFLLPQDTIDLLKELCMLIRQIPGISDEP